MNAAELLVMLNAYGEDESGTYNDEQNGWFAWSVKGDVLTVSWRECGADGERGEQTASTWRLVPVGVQVPEPWASVAPGDPHPHDPAERIDVPSCFLRFDEEGLTGNDEHGWICSRDRHADPLHVATTGPIGGYVVALYNTETREYRRTPIR